MASLDNSSVSQISDPVVPDYISNPNAVLKDSTATWRNGSPPDYSKTRAYFDKTKKSNHELGSLPDLVQNLVKNWEIEASFKTNLADWRTIDHDNYSFAINGGPPQNAEHMLHVGTYNAILSSNDYYSPMYSDFESSHKTFKRMMPTFAWEVLEVYSGPPQVVFKWRHWGIMKHDYAGFNDKGEKISAKAHGGLIDIQGVTIALVDDALRVQKLETWFDPLEMFRQIAPDGTLQRNNGHLFDTETKTSPSNGEGISECQTTPRPSEDTRRYPGDLESKTIESNPQTPPSLLEDNKIGDEVSGNINIAGNCGPEASMQDNPEATTKKEEQGFTDIDSAIVTQPSIHSTEMDNSSHVTRAPKDEGQTAKTERGNTQDTMAARIDRTDAAEREDARGQLTSQCPFMSQK